MSKSTSIHKYPVGMVAVLESVCYTGAECVIPYPDEPTAKRERFQFYGLVRAIKISDHTLAKPAEQLVFALTGANRNILKITLGHVVKNDFYSQIADKHRNTNLAAGPTPGEQAVAALAAEKQQAPEQKKH